MAASPTLGVYLHYPWCRKLCPYCDFAVEVGTPEHDAYLAAILRELARARAARSQGGCVSIYLGGGTPSLWRARLHRGRRSTRSASGSGQRRAEVTLEANPTDCDDAHLAAWRAAGVNRISIGVQSLDSGELVVLGRDHRFGDGMAAVERVLAAGGFTVTADFILGVPPRAHAATGSAARADASITSRSTS